MPEPIPKDIEREDVLQAIEAFNSGIRHGFGRSTTYDLVHEGERYPPKAILGISARRSMGRMLKHDEFKGGERSKCFRVLRRLGFKIVKKTEAEQQPTSDPSSPDTPGPEEEDYREAQRLCGERSFFARHPGLVRAAKAKHGCRCQVCGFVYKDLYGGLGEDYIEAHHLNPLSERSEEDRGGGLVTSVDEIAVLCSNCHRMIHRRRPALTLEELRSSMKR